MGTRVLIKPDNLLENLSSAAPGDTRSLALLRGRRSGVDNKRNSRKDMETTTKISKMDEEPNGCSLKGENKHEERRISARNITMIENKEGSIST